MDLHQLPGIGARKPRPSRQPDLEDLRAFVAVAEASGFRRASKASGLKQSVLSRRVRSLEDALGASLFERTRDGVKLTYAGSRFIRKVRMVFSEWNSAIRAVRSAGSVTEGCIKVGTVASIASGFLNHLFRDWRTAHEGVALEFEAALPQENVARVVARQIDVAVVTGTPSIDNIEIATLWREDVFAALPARHPLAGVSAIDLEQLHADRFLVTRHPPGPEIYDWIISRLSGLGVSPTVEEQSVGCDTLLSMVGLGFGVTLASSAETSIGYPDVSFVRVRGEQLPFSFVWSPTNDNPALRRFLSEARALSRRWPDEPSRTPYR